MRLSGVSLVLAMAMPSLAWAQDQASEEPAAQDQASEEPSAQAEALFEEGTAALQEGRFAEAVERYTASLDLLPQLATAFNLAVALRGVGRTRAAVELFDELLDERYGAFDDAWRATAEELRRETVREIARLSITLEGAEAAQLRIDGVPAGELRAGAPLLRRVDAGTHVLAALASGRATEDVSVRVERGGEATVELRFTEEEGGGSALPWVLLGSGIAVVAAVIIVVLLTTGGEDPEFEEGDVFGVTFT
ncbi:MAG: hypothetical protein AAGF12_05700 [Myxococcota bacterium]